MSTLSLTLSRYIARHFIFAILLVIVGLLAVSSLLNVFELLRRAAKYQTASFGIVMEMVALKTPYILERMMPYAVFIGSMLALTRLTRTHELIVARAAGVSVWQFLFPAIMVVGVLGSMITMMFNPLSSALLARFEQLEVRYLTGKGSLLTFSPSGLWIRQIEDHPASRISEHIINAAKVTARDLSFENVIIFSFDQQKEFTERLDAKRAKLRDGSLELSQVIRSQPGKPPVVIERMSMPTSLTMEYIQDSFASPETMSFWRLPSFITMLEEAGFSAMRHRLYYQSLLANPFLMAGMVWVAAVFSLRLPRRGRVGTLIVAGLLTGFLLYFFTDLVHALGAAGTLPISLAAWAPALVMLMIGAALLLHIEDG